MIHHVNKIKNKNYIIISIDAEKISDKIQYPFIIKTLNKLAIERTYLYIMKATYDKHLVNIVSIVKSFQLFL